MEKKNKLIAEFMGCTHPHNEITDATLYNVSHGTFELSELRYDVSWDWLMPVIEKCLVGEAEQSEEVSNTTIKNIYEGICNQDISFAYKSVVEFIKNKKN